MKVVMIRRMIDKWIGCPSFLDEEIVFEGTNDECRDWIERKKCDLAIIIIPLLCDEYFCIDVFTKGFDMIVSYRDYLELNTKYVIKE